MENTCLFKLLIIFLINFIKLSINLINKKIIYSEFKKKINKKNKRNKMNKILIKKLINN